MKEKSSLPEMQGKGGFEHYGRTSSNGNSPS